MTKPFEPEMAIDAYLDGELTADEQAQLRAWLAENPQRGAQILAQRSMLHTRLALMHVPVAPAETVSPASPSSALQKVAHFFTRPPPLSIIVAALFIGLVITTMAFIAAPIYRHLATPERLSGEYAPPVIVARLSGAHEAVWAEGQIGTRLGAYLPAGHRMELRSGLAEITFVAGARITFEGPGVLVLNSDGDGFLESGKLVAYVSEEAIGFAVHTNAAVVTDLGTEFSVAVDKFGNVDTYVYRGRVALAARAQSDAKILTAGQGMRVAVGGQLVSLDTIPSSVNDIGLGGARCKPLAIAGYEYIGENSNPRTSIHAAFGDEGYPDDELTKLTDGRIGTRNHIDGRWVGWFDQQSVPNGDSGQPQPAIVFDLGDSVAIDSLGVAYLVEHRLAIHAPERVVVSVSEDGNSFSEIESPQLFDDRWPNAGSTGQGNGTSRIALIEMGGTQARYVRLEFYNDQQWTFLSEVILLASAADAGNTPP